MDRLRISQIRTASEFEPHRQFWKEALAGVRWVPACFPADYPAGSGADAWAELSLPVPPEDERNLDAAVKGHPVAAFVWLTAVMRLALSRYGAPQHSYFSVCSPHAGGENITLALALEEQIPFRQWLNHTRQFMQQATAFAAYPSFAVRAEAQGTEEPQAAAVSLHWDHIQPVQEQEEGAELAFSLSGKTGSLQLKVRYRSNKFLSASVADYAQVYLTLLHSSLHSLNAEAGQLEALDADMRQRLLVDYNVTQRPIPEGETFISYWLQIAGQFEHRQALVSGDARYTYGEMRKKVAAVSECLRITYGIDKGDFVAMRLPKSEWTVFFPFALWHAGIVHVPIPPDFPEERVEALLAETGCKAFVVTEQEKEWARQRNQTTAVISLPELIASSSGFKGEEAPHSIPADTAYVIFTSGSTGKPKGVVMDHRSFLIRCLGLMESVNASADVNVLQFASIGFDAGYYEMCCALLVGATLVVATQEEKENPRMLLALIEREEVGMLSLPPAYLMALDRHPLPGVLKIASVGDAAMVGDAMHYAGLKQFYNGYGPTEVCVGSHSYLASAHKDYRAIGSVPIGKPFANTACYIVDAQLRLLPPGAAGEMLVSGPSLSPGYLHRPDLTAEKFIANPFSQEAGYERVYRTGDLCRWDHEGNILFSGRNDEQVQVNGIRVEPAEVEGAMLAHAQITAVAVVADQAKGQTRLLAYWAGLPLTEEEWRKWLAPRLPGWMIPASFIHLDQFPVNANGKVDRRQLPRPAAEIHKNKFTPAQNAPESLLCSIWAEVLQVPEVSTTESFFSLGGDSIRAILVSSRLYREGWRMEVRDLFLYPTVRELAQVLKPLTALASQATFSGELPLSAAQRWFFDQLYAEPHHWNQSLALFSPQPLAVESLRVALLAVVNHHDALRAVFVQEGSDWKQIIQPQVSAFEELVVEECETAGQENINKKVKALGSRMQSTLRLSEGPLLRAALVKTPAGDHLLFIAHHLLVDAVSWRIVLDDLQLAYQQALAGNAVSLPVKTNGLQVWMNAVQTYAQRAQLKKQLPFWRTQPSVKQPPRPRVLLSEVEHCAAALSTEHTAGLLREALIKYNLTVPDLLLTAAASAWNRLHAGEPIVIMMEGHGREAFHADAPDVSRTVGWFTSLFPLAIDFPGEEMSDRICHVKEQLRRIPQNGFGYGLLKYLSDASLPALQPLMSFNYLGIVGRGETEGEPGGLRLSGADMGPSYGPGNHQAFHIELSCLVAGEKLSVTVSASPQSWGAEFAARFSSAMIAELESLIAHCMAPGEPRRTASDAGAAWLSQADWNQVLRALPAVPEKVFRLTPMQLGLLFHTLQSRGFAYHEQLSLSMDGELNAQLWQASFQWLTDRYEVLRTAFLPGIAVEPLQAVLPVVKVQVPVTDLSQDSESDQEAKIEGWLKADREKGFDFAQAPLMRMHLVKRGPEKWQLLLSHHHILLDGWCVSLLMGDFFHCYQSLLAGRELQLEAAKPYSDYLKWLDDQSSEEAENWWRGQLAGFESQVHPPGWKNAPTDPRRIMKEFYYRADAGLSRQLEALASAQSATLNHLFLAVWGLMLARSNRSSDVIFGSIVSGRPPALPGVESIAGLFINQVPLRLRISEDMTGNELIEAVRSQRTAGAPFEYFALSQIFSLHPLRQELINHIVAFQNYPRKTELEQAGLNEHAGFSLSGMGQFEQTHYDLTVMVTPGENLEVKFTFDEAHYDPDSISWMAAFLDQLFREITAHPERPVSRIPLLNPAAQLQCVQRLNPAETALPPFASVAEWVAHEAALHPRAAALRQGNESMDYETLHQQALKGAAWLQHVHALRAGEGMVLVMRPSMALPVALMSAFLCRAWVVMVDPDLPAARISFLVADSGARLVMGEEEVSQSLTGSFIFIHARNLLHEVRLFAGSFVPDNPQRGDVAFLQYSSGSAGHPKAAKITQGNLLNLLSWYAQYLAFTPADVFAAKTTISFGDALAELLLPLTAGGAVYLRPHELAAHDLPVLLQWMESIGTTITQFVPSVLDQLLSLSPGNGWMKSMRHLVLSGEALKKTYSFPFVVHNLYGNSECTALSSWWQVPPTADKILIGKPVANTRLYVLDEDGNVLPPGIAGELYIAGASVGLGYHQRPELEAKKFVQDWLKAEEKMYRTGDLVRWLADGNLEFLGRVDEMVKVRGFRIEPGEVEFHLLRIAGVQEAIVAARAADEGPAVLAAWLRGDAVPTVAEMRTELTRALPDYMIPTEWHLVDAFPLNVNGKIDRKQLLQMSAPASMSAPYAEPRSEDEKLIARLFAQVLEVERVGLYDNFFELGGYSLPALSIVSLIRQETGVEIRLHAVFNHPVVADFAAYFASCRADYELMGWSQAAEPVEVVWNEEGADPLFLFPPGIGFGLIYYNLAECLAPRKVVAFHFIEEEDRLDQYVALISAHQPAGAVSLAGYSAGGSLAFAVAQSLEAAGREVKKLVLFDSYRRLQPTPVSEEEVNRYTEQYISDDENHESHRLLQSEELRETARRKISAYYRYFTSTPDEGMIQAPILFVASVDDLSAETMSSKAWAEATSAEFVEVQGAGAHFAMVNRPFVEENVKWLR